MTRIAIDLLNHSMGSGAAAREAYFKAHPDADVRLWQGYWEAQDGSAGTIPNRGVAGAALNAISTGVSKVTGPGVYVPGVIGNCITAQDTPAVTTIPTLWEEDVKFFLPTPVTAATYITGCTSSNYAFLIELDGRISVYWIDNAAAVGYRLRTSLVVVTGPGLYHLKIKGNLATKTFEPLTDLLTGNTYAWAVITDTGVPLLPTQYNKYMLGAHTLGTHSGADKLIISGSRRITADSNKFFELKPSDIPFDPAATGFNLSSGQAVTINRPTANASTAIIPAGKTAYCNPEIAAGTNKITTPDHAIFDIANIWGYFNLTEGVASNTHLSIPNSAPLTGLTAGEWVFKVKLPATFNGTSTNIWSQQTSGGELGYFIAVTASGTLQMGISTTGAAWAVTATLTNPGELVANTTMWVKVTWNGTQLKGHFAADQKSEPSSWTASAAAAVAYAGPMFTIVSAPVRLGYLWNVGVQQFHRAILRSSVGGSVVLDIGASDVPASGTSFVCKTGQTVTINGPITLTARGGDSYCFFFMGEAGNMATGTTYLSTIGSSTEGVSLRKNAATTGIAGRVDTAEIAATVTSNATIPEHALVLHMVVYNATTRNLRYYRQTQGQATSFGDVVLDVLFDGIIPTVGIVLLESVGGVAYKWGFNKGVGKAITQDEFNKIAQYLFAGAM